MSPARRRRRRMVADGLAVRALHGSQAWALRPKYGLCFFPSVSLATQAHSPCVDEHPLQMLRLWRRRGQVRPPARLPANCSAQTLSVPLLQARSCPAPSSISASLSVTSVWQSCHFQNSLLPFCSMHSNVTFLSF